MKAVDATTTTFESANSTLFLVLGGLSCFQRLRSGMGVADGKRAPWTSDARTTEARPTRATDDDAGAVIHDQVTLAVLGLLAAGQRLTEVCVSVAEKTGPRPRQPANATVSEARLMTRQQTPLRAVLR